MFGIQLTDQLKNTLLVTVIATSLTEVLFSLVQNVIIPLFDIDIDGDDVKELKSISQKVLIMNNKKIYIGKFLYLFIKFLLIGLILWLIGKMF